jgi:hypothetical protein
MNPYFLPVQTARQAKPALEGKAREAQGRTGLALFLQGLKAGKPKSTRQKVGFYFLPDPKPARAFLKDA